MKYIKSYIVSVFAATPILTFTAFVVVWFTFHVHSTANYIFNNYTNFFSSDFIELIIFALMLITLVIGISAIGTVVYFIYKKLGILPILMENLNDSKNK
jgi:hypothetical protein